MRGIFNLALIFSCAAGGYFLGGFGNPAVGPAQGGEFLKMSRSAPSAKMRSHQRPPLENFDALLADKDPSLDIWKTISQLSLGEIQDAAQRLKKAKELVPKTYEMTQLNEMECAFYFHWAEMDPVAALAQCPKDTDSLQGQRLISSVLCAWMQKDPDAAYQAVMNDPKIGYKGRNLFVKTWTPETLFKNLEKYPAKHQDLLGAYAAASGNNTNPTQRDSLLQVLKDQPDLKNRDWAYMLLFRNWGYRDFTEAIQAAEKQEQRWIKDLVLKDNITSNPHLAIPWATSHGMEPTGSSWEQGYSIWLQLDSDAARKWLAAQIPTWQQKGKESVIASFMAQDLGNSGKMKDPAGRDFATKQLENFLNSWKTKDRSAAENWLDIAPKSVREHFADPKNQQQ